MSRPPAPLLLVLAAAAPSCTPPPAAPAPTTPTAILVLPAASADPTPPPAPEEDAEPRRVAAAPGASKLSFSLPSLNNAGTATLTPGKVNVVHFWATWCAPCQKVMPRLDALYQRYKAQGLVVIGVSVDDDEDMGGIAAFAANLGLKFPVAWDEGLKVVKQWPVKTMPSTFIVDRSGAIRFTYDGYKDGDEASIEERVKQLF